MKIGSGYFSLLPLILGLILGFLIVQLAKPAYKSECIFSVVIDTVYTSGGNTVYWKNDTLWKDANHTIFLKVYPEKLLK